MRVMASGPRRLGSQVEEVSRDERNNEASKSPQRGRAPERARQEQEEIWDLDIVRARVEKCDRRDRERVTVGKELFAQVVEFERNHYHLNSHDC